MTYEFPRGRFLSDRRSDRSAGVLAAEWEAYIALAVRRRDAAGPAGGTPALRRGTGGAGYPAPPAV